MKSGGIWRWNAADLAALEGLDQVSSNMFPISWLRFLPRSDEHFQSHVYYCPQCSGVRFYEFHFHSDYM
jgi:hypothetical protein